MKPSVLTSILLAAVFSFLGCAGPPENVLDDADRDRALIALQQRTGLFDLIAFKLDESDTRS